MNIPKITILLDDGYHPEHLRQELENVYPQIMRKIKFERSTKPSKQEKAATEKSGFVPAVARWGKRTLECLDENDAKSSPVNDEENAREGND